MTKQQAKKYCLIVWNYRRKTGCLNDKLSKWLQKKHPIILTFKWKCAYCEKYSNDFCKSCPLKKVWGLNCHASSSAYHEWDTTKNVKIRKEYARIIYNDIKRS